MIKKAFYFCLFLGITLYYFSHRGWIQVTPAGWQKAGSVLNEGKNTVRTIVKKAVELSEEAEQPPVPR